MKTGWAAISLSLDVPARVVLPVCLHGVDLALWRSASGAVALWGDRCPHRGMRLSHGFVRGNTLACIYHGWQYGSDGACRYIPAHPDLEPPPSIRAETYPVSERDGVIWGALAEPQSPPPALPGYVPLRSMEAHAPLDVWQTRLDEVQQQPAFDHMTLLLQPIDRERTMLHALISSSAQLAAKKQASRHLETLRRAIEEDATW